MSQAFEYWIGNRYVRSRSSNSFVSLISAISMLGIAIAVMVLIVVMSVVNGFERELKDRLLAMTSHASIESTDGRLTSAAALAQVLVHYDFGDRLKRSRIRCMHQHGSNATLLPGLQSVANPLKQIDNTVKAQPFPETELMP